MPFEISGSAGEQSAEVRPPCTAEADAQAGPATAAQGGPAKTLSRASQPTPRRSQREPSTRAGRAASGESSIYQDQDGRWHGYVSLGLKENGRRDRRHVSGRTRKEVVAKVRELEAKRDAGTAGAAGKAPTVGQWLEHWLNAIAARKVRPSTLTRYRQLTANQLLPGIGHHRLDRLQPEHVETLYGELMGRGLAPATVLQAHRVLSRALKVAMQRGKLARNVCSLVDAPSLQRTEVQPLTGGEARKVLSAATGRRNAARWSVALALGLRQGEALGLAWDAVDLDRGLLTVRQALQRQSGKGLVLVQPKSRAGRRVASQPTVPRPCAVPRPRQPPGRRGCTCRASG